MIIDWSNFSLDWKQFCDSGLEPYDQDANVILPCFQEIVLQFPIYTIFAAVSAYKFGSCTRGVIRNATQIRALKLRAIISLLLAVLLVLKFYYLHRMDIRVFAADILLNCTKILMWIVHSAYLFASCRLGDLNHRGPLIVIVVWLAVVVLDVVWVYSTLQIEWWLWGCLTILLNVFYGLALLPKGNAIRQVGPHGENVDETSALLPSRYTYFEFNFNEMHLGQAQDEANLTSRSLFNWVKPLITKAAAGNLKRIEDLFDLPNCLSIIRLSERLQASISSGKILFWALHECFGLEFYLIGILRFLADICGFAGPLLLGGLLTQTTENEDSVTANSKPYLYALGLLGTQVLIAFCTTHFGWRISLVTMKMRIGIVSAIYKKSLDARGVREARPEILNLMSTDTDRIVNSCISFHSFWSIPFQLVITLYLLYTQLGAAFLAGLLFAISLIPTNRWLAKRIQHYSTNLMTAKDDRVSATSEILNGAKAIKLHAWENVFMEKIRKFREVELKYLAKRKYLDAWCVYFWATTPILMCLLTFGVSVLSGHHLLASTTYTSVALLNLLIGPLNAFPWVLNGLIEAQVSIQRIQELLNLPNLDYSAYYSLISNNDDDGGDDKTIKMTTFPLDIMELQLKNASFKYQSTTTSTGTNGIENNSGGEQIFLLENINLNIKNGELVCIEGSVGAGKSCLLSALVGDMQLLKGSICLREELAEFAYVPQIPWLQRGTIRENIVWGAIYDEQWYKTVLYACALIKDVKILGGDLIHIGENGHKLSGGQRARITLARAVYQNKKIYIFDDVLAALDAHVAQHIVKHCILDVLRDKTRIIVTQHATLLYNANQIMHITNGKLVSSEYMSRSIDISLEENESLQLLENERTIHLNDFYSRSSSAINKDNSKQDEGEEEAEKREFGFLSINVFKCYWDAVQMHLGFLVLLSIILMQLFRNLSDAWFAHWVTESTLNNCTNTSANGTGYYLGIYSALAVTNSVITLARAFLFAYAGLKAAKVIHNQLVDKVLHSKFEFFNVTSLGRLLNRFSSDVYTVDDSLPFILNILLAQIFSLLGAVLISLYAMPWLSLVIVPLIPIYLNLQHRYRYASRDIKRLSSNAMSPLYIHFTETLQGLVIIRCMRATARFLSEFHMKLEDSIKAQLTQSAAQNWVSLRLQLLGAGLVGGAGILAVITSAHEIHPGLVGLAISYALSISGTLAGVLNAMSETEQEFVAVERLNEYFHLDREENAEALTHPPFAWPSQGVLVFHNVQLRYGDNLNLAVKNFSLKTEAFEHLAIVGRTGAGKSSILAALMKVSNLTSGDIILDYVNLKHLAVKHIRERIDIIPQDPFLFEGTVRENLDPAKNYYDTEVWHAITNSSAVTYLVQSLGGLDGRIEIAGSNLSGGQKQLLCLTRSLLKNAKVICIDEGTSNLDATTELAIQQIIKNSFKTSTVICIAHRLQYLNHMDRIVVMEEGLIREQGAPHELAENSNSLFHSMLQAQHVDVKEFCNHRKS